MNRAALPCCLALLAAAPLARAAQPAPTPPAQEQPSQVRSPPSPARPGPDATTSAASPVRDLERRLESLSPDEPLAYFELGEEVAAEMPTTEGRTLARTLFVLAYELSRASDGAPASLPGLQAGACLALATIASSDDQRRRLIALAEGHRVGAWSAAALAAPTPVRETSDAAFALATALGFARAEDFARAAPILDRSDVRALLERHGAMLGGADAFVREVRSRPSCRECKNSRIVRAEPSSRDTPPPWRLCRTCAGNPSLGLTPQLFLSHLRVEAILLAGPQQAWSTQLLADGGAPLAELDPDSLAGAFDIDPDLTVYRDGTWTRP